MSNYVISWYNLLEDIDFRFLIWRDLMNKIKIVVGLFIFTCILSLNNVNAASYLGFANITVPSMQGLYTSRGIEKTTISNQYVNKIAARDKLSNDDRAIGARLQDITTEYMLLETGKNIKLLNDNAGLGQVPGTYKLTLKAQKWTISEVSFSGTWYLDDYLIN